jgi:hypothetical protein
MSTDLKGLKSAFDLKTEDSRLKYNRVTHPTLPLERTYCVVCAKPKGWVTTESSEYIRANNIIVICEDCSSAMGSMPLQEVDIKEVK